MIDIKRKETCVGCKACANICPKSCISLLVDDMGFAYPKVDTEKCINCHLCEQVCPILYPFSEVKTQRSFALVNKDVKQVLSSSSGGLFIELSKYLINNGGVVYGAVYSKNYKFVEYARATKISELNSFKGSKYVQADLDNVFFNIKEDLQKGIKVLFSGTPCYVKSLRNYLRREYPNLYAVDLICHGVPSPLVYERYIDFVQNKSGNVIQSITMRDKKYGWKHRLFLSIKMADNRYIIDRGISNVYMEGFSKNLFLRPSCFECRYTNLNRPGDLTIADYWGIERITNRFKNSKGVSLCICNNNKGFILLNNILSNFDYLETPLDCCIQPQPQLQHSFIKPDNYVAFWKDWESTGGNFPFIAKKYLKYSMKDRLTYQIKKRIKILIGKDF